jgi:hypothetical protein
MANLAPHRTDKINRKRIFEDQWTFAMKEMRGTYRRGGLGALATHISIPSSRPLQIYYASSTPPSTTIAAPTISN